MNVSQHLSITLTINRSNSLNCAGSSTMIEADVVAGYLMNGEEMIVEENQERMAIMGHPPTIVSDLSLEEFLLEWSRTTKGLKLDFKSTDAFMMAIPIMEKVFKVNYTIVFIFVVATNDYFTNCE